MTFWAIFGRTVTSCEDVEAHALRRRGWSIAAMYCRLRRNDDPHLWSRPHLWSSVLFDEVVALGSLGGYSTFTRALRRQVRPRCEPCRRTDGRDVAITEHQAGEVSAGFAAVAKYYGATAVVCPPRRGNVRACWRRR